MCGRFALHAASEVLALQFGLASPPRLAPRYNIAPGTDILAVRAPLGAREAALLRWGLVPAWAKEPAIGARTINARAETVAEKPAFRAAFRRRRCLVPASGFYEWQARPAGKQPWYIRPRDESGIFAFAALWERWRGPDGPLETCAIVVTAANAALAPIHDRMPVILAPRDWARWLDCDPAADVRDLLRPCEPDLLVLQPVGRAVNDARREGPALIEPQPGASAA